MNSNFLTDEINDALFYKDIESLKQIVSKSKSDGNYSFVDLKLCDYNLNFLSVFAPFKQFDCLWSTEKFAHLIKNIINQFTMKNPFWLLLAEQKKTFVQDKILLEQERIL